VNLRSIQADALIVGGGPAGLATAIALRQKGLRVMVAEAARPPIDKACGEGLMPNGVEALRKLGVKIGVYDSAPFHGIRFIEAPICARGNFGGVRGIGIRRTVLHTMLIERAADAGVELRWGQRISPADLAVQARWIIGADGQRSFVRRWAGLDCGAPRVRRFGFRYHCPVAPWSDCVDVHWGDRCQIYITPVSAESLCVAVISSNPHLRLEDALLQFPEVASRLQGAAPATVERGSVTESRRLRRVVRGSVALVGDASGSVDAITGEGLSLAFQQSLALADAIEANDLELYQSAHRKLARVPALTARGMLLMDRHRLLRQSVLRTFSQQPGWFSGLLMMHIGGRSLSSEAITNEKMAPV